MMFFLWNSNLYNTAAHQLEWETVSCNWMPLQTWTLHEWLELERTTLHVVRGYTKSKLLPVYTMVAKVPAWIHQWAAELLKKQIASTHWYSVEPGFGSLPSAPHHYIECTTSPLLAASSLTVTTNRTERVSLCNGELYRTYFGIGQSQPLSEQCRCIVAMCRVGGFGGLMQQSFVQGPRTSKCCKLKVENFCCCSKGGWTRFLGYVIVTPQKCIPKETSALPYILG